MKKILFVVLCFIFTTGVWAQETSSENKYALKLYNVVSFWKHTQTEGAVNGNNTGFKTSSHFQAINPAVALQWRVKSNVWKEVELTSLNFTKNTTTVELTGTDGTIQQLEDTEVKTLFAAARYEHIVGRLKSIDKKFVPSFGVSISPFYKLNEFKFSQLFSSYTQRQEQHIGFQAFLSPRATYHFNSKLFLDINASLCLMNSAILFAKNNHPAVVAEDQESVTFTYQMLPPIFMGRLGIGLKI